MTGNWISRIGALGCAMVVMGFGAACLPKRDIAPLSSGQAMVSVALTVSVREAPESKEWLLGLTIQNRSPRSVVMVVPVSADAFYYQLFSEDGSIGGGTCEGGIGRMPRRAITLAPLAEWSRQCSVPKWQPNLTDPLRVVVEAEIELDGKTNRLVGEASFMPRKSVRSR